MATHNRQWALIILGIWFTPMAMAADSQTLFFRPAGDCINHISEPLNALKTRLSDAAKHHQTFTYPTKTLTGALKTISVQLKSTVNSAQTFWEITGNLSNKGCGMMTNAKLVCYLVDPCLNKVGPASHNQCDTGPWPSLNQQYNLACNLLLPSTNMDAMTQGAFQSICSSLSPHLIQDGVLFDIVSADGKQQCNVFW